MLPADPAPREETIDVLSYLRRLARYLVPALVLGALVGLVTYFTTRGETESTYVQKAHVLVMPNPVDTEGEATQQNQLMPMMLRTYVALEDVPVFVDAVSKKTQGKWSPEEVAEDLTINWGGGSNLLAFHATDPIREEADQLANAGAEVFVQVAEQMAPGGADWKPTLTVVERSKQQSEPAVLTTGPMPAIGAFLVSTLLAMFALEALNAARARRRRATRPTAAAGSSEPR